MRRKRDALLTTMGFYAITIPSIVGIPIYAVFSMIHQKSLMLTDAAMIAEIATFLLAVIGHDIIQRACQRERVHQRWLRRYAHRIVPEHSLAKFCPNIRPRTLEGAP